MPGESLGQDRSDGGIPVFLLKDDDHADAGFVDKIPSKLIEKGVPVSLDDAWKDKVTDVLWEHLTKKNILDFRKWKTKALVDPGE